MASIAKRLAQLEHPFRKSAEWEIPIEVQVQTKAVARHQAQEEGTEPPPYTREEIEEMRRDDLEIVAGGGVVGDYRESAGWQSEEGQSLLDEWEEDAHRRLEQAENLPPEEWHLVWGADEEDEGGNAM